MPLRKIVIAAAMSAVPVIGLAAPAFAHTARPSHVAVGRGVACRVSLVLRLLNINVQLCPTAPVAPAPPPPADPPPAESMNDLVSEYQQYQDATVEESGEFDEGE